jgi:hypothetical protein
VTLLPPRNGPILRHFKPWNRESTNFMLGSEDLFFIFWVLATIGSNSMQKTNIFSDLMVLFLDNGIYIENVFLGLSLIIFIANRYGYLV